MTPLVRSQGWRRGGSAPLAESDSRQLFPHHLGDQCHWAEVKVSAGPPRSGGSGKNALFPLPASGAAAPHPSRPSPPGDRSRSSVPCLPPTRKLWCLKGRPAHPGRPRLRTLNLMAPPVGGHWQQPAGSLRVCRFWDPHRPLPVGSPAWPRVREKDFSWGEKKRDS